MNTKVQGLGMRRYFLLFACFLCVATLAPAQDIRPQSRPTALPSAAWDGQANAGEWSRAALEALQSHGRPLEQVVPADVAQWCPAYRGAGPGDRRAFWLGLLSVLSKHESGWRPKVVGSGRWYGLLQIQPSTARGYGCLARTGDALRSGPANLSCAVRIWSITVIRDGLIAQKSAGRWRGIAADWGPMTMSAKRRDMMGWIRGQPYCQITTSLRPMARAPALSSQR